MLLFPCVTYIFTSNLETTPENTHETTGHYNPEDFILSIFRRILRSSVGLFRNGFRFFKSCRLWNVPRGDSVIPKAFDEELMLFILPQNGFRSAGSFIPRSAGSIVVENEGVITALAWLHS